MSGALLEVTDLHVGFRTDEGLVRAVDGVSFSVSGGEVVAIVGESGSGKSATVMSLVGLTRSARTVISGSAYLGETELLSATERTLRKVRGAEVGMVFQDPMSALNPAYRVGAQICEQIRTHHKVSRRAAKRRAVDLMRRAGIPQPERRANAYPHELSGGLRQRVMIAMALSCGPQVIVADEPTTALDVTIQEQILHELMTLRDETGVGIILVTHDLGVVAQIADTMLVMYAGHIVESAPADELFDDPWHPYTWGLLGSVPRSDRPRRGVLPAIEGSLPRLTELPSGCRFAPRCPFASDECRANVPLTAPSPKSAHFDRCVLTKADKRRLRAVEGEIGLAAEGR